MVRDQPDPPNAIHPAPHGLRWGISSAGRAPALQAGGRRFDPVILHQYLPRLKKKRWWHKGPRNNGRKNHFLKVLPRKTFRHWFYHQYCCRKTVGCSLKIHRVEISVVDAKCIFVKVSCTPRRRQHFDCVKNEIQFCKSS